MSDIEARIAEVLRGHSLGSSLFSIGDDPRYFYRCKCGYRSHVESDAPGFNAHLSAVLVKELGLKRERGRGVSTGISRWTTDWSKDE